MYKFASFNAVLPRKRNMPSPGCGVEIELFINAGADKDIKKVTVRYSANVHHDTSYLSC
jgi:hypothetical protein